MTSAKSAYIAMLPVMAAARASGESRFSGDVYEQTNLSTILSTVKMKLVFMFYVCAMKKRGNICVLTSRLSKV